MIYVDEDQKLFIAVDQLRAIARQSLEDDTQILLGFKNLPDSENLLLAGDPAVRFWNWLVEKWRSGEIS